MERKNEPSSSDVRRRRAPRNRPRGRGAPNRNPRGVPRRCRPRGPRRPPQRRMGARLFRRVPTAEIRSLAAQTPQGLRKCRKSRLNSTLISASATSCRLTNMTGRSTKRN
nr:hypothetical protein [uncultured bacterium]